MSGTFPPRRLNTAAVFSGVYAAIALLIAVPVLMDGNARGFGFLAASLVLGVTCFGLNRRRRWAWRLGLVIYGQMTFLVVGLTLICVGYDLFHGYEGTPFGRFSLIWLFVGLLFTPFFAIPWWNLRQGRSELLN